eukprot:CAMPEP_0172501964 /NCGR_PEP_ID=MMETSP1066-20121228/155313_1 /TAXON_ID=671091 /ORGANISM="Coscinodiscus wailesii, Strain CCMP2513" /LENGTH=581 /DNA_ID=CAMNT_0013277041 /DNA_START=44 /DNA_END=1789 /DNA_ORIENTATION=+
MAPNVAELKARLKELGMSQAGDKGTLEYRIKHGEESLSLGLKTPDGDAVHVLKMAKLKKHAARAGISPIGTLDEIMFAYIAFLKKGLGNDAAATSTAGEASRPESNGGGKSKGMSYTVAQLSDKVLELAEGDDFLGILKLGAGANDVNASSSVSVLRKAYLKLSLALHPDKNRNSPDATKVFQAVVNAFERMSQPELVEEVTTAKKGAKKKKAAAISRSNEGCRRTRVRCPRCKNPWSESSVEGNPPYFYNFMMTGIKSFNCATCLLEFGCMTGIHNCPFCGRAFEYHPSDFHRKITCGSKTCHKPFGFHMYHVSDRVLKNLKIEVKQLREKQARTTEQKQRRAESSARRRCRDVRDDAEAETAFLMGLANECPRCGISLADLDDEDENDHLRNCNDDDGKITANKRKKEAIELDKAVKKRKEQLQDDVTAKATWDFLGGTNETMWMLTDGALEKECKDQGVKNTKGKEKHEIIASLVNARKTQSLTVYAGDRKGQGQVTSETLPSNLHSMTVVQLKAVAASHGIKVPAGSRKADIIDLLQRGQETSTLLLTDGASKTGKSRDEIIEIESGSDSEYYDSDD